MASINLPNIVAGNWIWTHRAPTGANDHALFQKIFIITDIPATNNLWISCRSNFTIYINNHLLSFGPSPALKFKYYAHCFDITHLLIIGKNQISIHAHNPAAPLQGCPKHTSGLWCQLDNNNKHIFATDETWESCTPKHICPRQNKISKELGFIDTQDLRRTPINWKRLNPHNNQDWSSAKITSKLIPTDLIPLQQLDLITTREDIPILHTYGICRAKSASINLELHPIVTKTGIYAARTYFFRSNETNETIEIFSDITYKVCLNGNLLRPTQTSQIISDSFKVTIHKGWNEISIACQCPTDPPGLTINLPSTKHNDIHLHQSPENEAPHGWKLYGPLNMPFGQIKNSLTLDLLHTCSYHNLRPSDPSAYLSSFCFEASNTIKENFTELTLCKGDYIILDITKLTRGIPTVTFEGTSGDIIDIIYGESCINNTPIPIHISQGRKTDSIILTNQETTWTCHSSRSFRYMTIHAREVHGDCVISDPAINIIQAFSESECNFNSSDDLLNNIYATSLQTLNNCYSFIFSNSPSKENSQYIHDSFIMGTTSISTTGNYHPSKKALIEFALSQYENGEIPVISPSGIHIDAPEHSLHWIKWLQKYLLFTDDHNILDKCLPSLTKLLDYYDTKKHNKYYALKNDTCESETNEELYIIDTSLNALYCRALHSAAWIFEYAKRPEEARKADTRASKIAKTMQQLTWNEDKGLFADSFINGEQSNSYNLKSNILAMYGALPPTSDYKSIFNQIFSQGAPFFKLPTPKNLTPFLNYFILETAFSLNQRKWALHFIKWYWGSMLEAGATTWWETHNPTQSNETKTPSSLCHGYGVSPNIYIISDIIGIRPASPGFEQAYFSPLTESCDWAKATIPTPRGTLKIEWENSVTDEISVAIKSNFPIDIMLRLPLEIIERTTFHVSEEVNILSDI